MEKRFKKGVVTTTQEVTKKVPAPKYSTKVEYLLHIKGHKPMLSAPTHAFFCDINMYWIYYFPGFTGGYKVITEEEFTNALIK